MNVQSRLLAGHSLGHTRVAVADTRHVVVHVDVPASLGVEQVGAFAANDVDWFSVEERHSGTHRTFSAGHH